MAYTTQQLVDLYTNANLGKGPDQALTLTLDALATQTQVGGLSDDAAAAATLKWVNGTTAVAIETYQFFTGKAPSADGLAFLINSTTNTNDLNDATGVYAKFSQENRFINFAVDLGVNGEGAAAFAASYGGTGVTYAQVVASAYDKIIGNAVATAAGVDVAATVAFFSRQANIDFLKSYLTSNGYTDPVKLDLAVKAALIGEILNAATVSGLGAYATATNAMIKDLSDGTLTNSASASIFVTYPAGPAVGEVKDLTTGIDTIPGTSAADTYTGVWAGAAGAATTLNPLDTIGGGAGQDTLNINATDDLTTADLSSLTITGIETISIRGAKDVGFNSSGYADVTALNVKQGAVVTATAAGTTAITVSGATDTITVNGGSTVSVSDSTANKAITIGNTTAAKGAVSVVDANQGTGGIQVNGGTDVSVTASKSVSGIVQIGNTTAPTGAVIVNSTGVDYDSGSTLSLGNISVTGGTSVVINQTATASNGDAAEAVNIGNETTLSAVSVTGGSKTTSVTVNQSAPVEAVNGRAAVAAIREVDTVTFSAVTAGTVVTVNGLNFTAAKALTAAEVASAFANLARSATHGSAAASLGTYSGAFTGVAGTTGAAADGKVAFTQATGTTGATISATNASVAVTTAGLTRVTAIEGIAGVEGNTVTIDGTGPATDVLATVSVSGYGAGSTVKSDALTKLSLAHSNEDLVVTNTAATTLALGLDSVGTDLGSGTVTGIVNLGAAYTSLNVTVTGDSTVALAAGGVKALTVAGSAAVDLTGSTLGSLETVVVSGSAGVTANASGATVKSVDASATSGNNVFSIDASKATYKGGTGADSVTLTSTTVSKAITLGAGDDKLTLATGTAASSVVLDGGDGTDTLAMVAADAAGLSATAAFGAKITGFEKLQVTDTVLAGSTRIVDLSNLTNINYVVSANANVVSAAEKFTATITGTATGADQIVFDGITATLVSGDTAIQAATRFAAQYNAASGANWTAVDNGDGTITFTAKTNGPVTDVTTAAFTYVDAGAVGTPTVTGVVTNTQGADAGLTINKFGANGTLELNTAGAGVTVSLADNTGTSDVFNIVLKNDGATNFGKVSVSGVETINVTATDTDLITSSTPEKMTLAISDSALKTLVVTGNAAFELNGAVASLTSIDGSAMTSALTATVSATNATITGGAGGDVLTASGNSETLLGGAGNDTLIAKGDLDILTGGAGNDTFDVSDPTTNVNSYATITDLSAGDLIKFKDIAATVETFTAAKLALGDTAVFQDYANQAISSTAVGAITWFQYGGNTYVVEHVSGTSSFVNNSDIIVKITGTVDLSTASLSAVGTGTVTLGIH